MSLAIAHEKALEFAHRLRVIGPISVTRFFGGAGLVRNGVQFAFIIKGVFYLRVDNLSRPDFEALGAAPFIYAGRSKTVTVASYYELPDKIANDHDELIRWVTRASHAATLAKSTGRRSHNLRRIQ
jgi:DNA transformation protein